MIFEHFMKLMSLQCEHQHTLCAPINIPNGLDGSEVWSSTYCSLSFILSDIHSLIHVVVLIHLFILSLNVY